MNATNLTIYGKLELTPRSVCRKVQVVKYRQRLCNDNEDLPIYLRDVYLIMTSENLKQYTKYYGYCQSFGSDQLNKYLTIV